MSILFVLYVARHIYYLVSQTVFLHGSHGDVGFEAHALNTAIMVKSSNFFTDKVYYKKIKYQPVNEPLQI